jgi:hypothetical protein
MRGIGFKIEFLPHGTIKLTDKQGKVYEGSFNTKKISTFKWVNGEAPIEIAPYNLINSWLKNEDDNESAKILIQNEEDSN